MLHTIVIRFELCKIRRKIFVTCKQFHTIGMMHMIQKPVQGCNFHCSVPRVWSSCCLSRVDHWSFAHMMILFVSNFLSDMSDSHWGDLRVSKSERDGASADDPGDVPEGEACSSVLVREGIFTTRWFLGRLVASQWWIMVKLGIPVAKAVYHLWQPYILQTGNSSTSVPGKAWKSYDWYSGPMTI